MFFPGPFLSLSLTYTHTHTHTHLGQSHCTPGGHGGFLVNPILPWSVPVRHWGWADAGDAEMGKSNKKIKHKVQRESKCLMDIHHRLFGTCLPPSMFSKHPVTHCVLSSSLFSAGEPPRVSCQAFTLVSSMELRPRPSVGGLCIFVDCVNEP